MSFQEHLSTDYPAALAPFAAAKQDTISISLLKLQAVTVAHSVAFDIRLGCFDFFDKLGRSIAVIYPWALLQERDRGWMLASFQPEKHDAIVDAARRAWQRMVEDLNDAVAVGEFRVVAREDSPLSRELIELPLGAWDTFDIEDWDHRVARCRITGSRLFDVCFRAAVAAKTTGASPPAPKLVRRGRPKGEVTQLAAILPQLYADGDPVAAGQRVETVRRACESKLGKSVSKSSVNRARKQVWPIQNSDDLI